MKLLQYRNLAIAFALAVFLAGGLGVGNARSATITVNLTGTISSINGGTTSAIGVDVVGIVAVGDSATMSLQFDPLLGVPSGSGNSISYSGAILGMSASLNGGALTWSYDSAVAGFNINQTLVNTTSDGYFHALDVDNNGASGPVTGSIIPTSDPQFNTDWNPLQALIFFSAVADNSAIPSMPAFEDARLDWQARGINSAGQLFGQQSNIYLDFTEVEFVSSVPVPAALPLFLSGLAGLGFFGWRRKQTAT
ncbi:MAG: VPLPA-CTERM sorting domain-containing protein [Proteobacteria bacterium]|nr:VPLPA-CTERM sorting domain-containing protein [Pseudomonadota bacterium]